ncbi:MAG: hypothetical protein AAFR29_09705, partial [Pseudomonadota bacterium]
MDRTRWRAKFRTALRRLTALVVGVVVGAGIMVSAAAQPQNEATDGAIYLTADHLVDVRNGV